MMESAEGENSSYLDDGYDATDWDDFGPASNSGKISHDRYSNAYGDYTGGYGPMNIAGGEGSLGGYGAMNNFGYGAMDMTAYLQPNFMGPGIFGYDLRSLYQPYEANYWMGRGYGVQGPIRQRRSNDRTIKFLLRCGVPNESIRNLPKSLLELMTEDMCGLCGQSFNAFPTARVHYVSKNHFKNQKKWLTQHSEGGLQANAEIPFKARELYCEICDVHITSKAHADSHYAGKPHRAIVEGRKMPRNPILLQKNMASRLEQLIRREKKYLKSIEGEEYKEQAGKDVKVTQPELYCKICKTSVTCTEQMTMHLNGKRHLAKEKQHILRMMKGENKNACIETKYGGDDGNEGDNAGGEDRNEEGNRVGEGDKESESDKSDDDDDDDWANGSGNWDEPETQW